MKRGLYEGKKNTDMGSDAYNVGNGIVGLLDIGCVRKDDRQNG